MIVKTNVKDRTRRLKGLGQGIALILLLTLSFTISTMELTNDGPVFIMSTREYHTLSAQTPVLNLTYTSRTNEIDTPVKSGDIIAGDHVVLKAEWTPSLVNQSRLEVNAHAIPAVISVEANQSTLEIDTRALGNNASCTITSTAWLTNGSIIVTEITEVYIGNFFVPQVELIAPNGGEIWTGIHNITWTASDANADDDLSFAIFLSTDSGGSFDTLLATTNLTWFEWDCTGFYQSDKSLIRVRVSDGIYFNSDISNSTFTAGAIVTTLPTSPTTTPTTPTTVPQLEPRIIVFVAILIFSCGVMALVVYYAATKWL